MESLIFLYRCAAAPRHASPVSFHDVRVKTFSTHVTTKIAPAVRETGLFTHARASLNFTIIPMCTPGVAMPCPCGAWQGGGMPLHPRSAAPSDSILYHNKKSASPKYRPAMMGTLIIL